jgi:TonB family protein
MLKPTSHSLLCPRCRTFYPEEQMRRVTTRSGERWRCLECLRETGWTPREKVASNPNVRQENLIDAILRDPHPTSSEKSFPGLPLLASLLFHAMLISLQFGSTGWGLLWLRSFQDKPPGQTAPIRAVLRLLPASVDAAPTLVQIVERRVVPTPRLEAPTPTSATRVRARGVVAASSPHPGSAATSAEEKRKRDSTAHSPGTASKAMAQRSGTQVLGTDIASPWQMAVASVLDEPQAGDSSEPAKTADPVVQEESSAAIAERALEEASAKAASELQQRKLAEEQLRIETEEQKSTLAAIAKAQHEEQERKLAEQRLRIESEKQLAEQAAVAKVSQEAVDRRRTEEQLRMESERAKAAEAALARTRQNALERKRLDAERRQLEQAAADQASREAAARQRATDREQVLQNAAGSKSQHAVGKAGEQGLSPPAKAPEEATNFSAGRPLDEATPSDRRRKARIVGPDPKNIQLAFYGESWRQKVERIGSVNYPSLHKDLYYDNLVVTVIINADGTLAGVRIDKSSGQPEMDDAVRRIVEMSAPFASFPPDMKRNFDQVEITRTWVFNHRPRIRNQ